MNKVVFNQELLADTKEYFLGLDIGTTSVGWSITDTQYNVIKKSGKALWGVRLFKEGETAASRRGFRSARRRRNRMKHRIQLLQEFFAPAINAIDPGFYIRMQDSFFLPEDKSENQHYALFNDKDYTDKDYNNAFPTIYHLRQELISNPQAHDPRLVYLACHHIMKNRGHFLFEGQRMNVASEIDNSVKSFANKFESLYGEEIFLSDSYPQVVDIITNEQLNPSDQARQINAFIASAKKSDEEKASKELIKLLVGNTGKLDRIFTFEETEELELKSLKFSDGSYLEDDKQNILDALISQDEKDLLDLAYAVYSASLLHKLLANPKGGMHPNISSARIATYEKHKDDLKRLKEIIKSTDAIGETSSLYVQMFRENKKGLANYVAYSGHVDGRDTSSPYERCNHEDFLKFIQKSLSKVKNEDEVARVLEECANGTFLPKITSSDNGIIPHQLHQQELESILRNAMHYVDGLTEETCEKITQIFTFRIPYYVGPFNDKSQFAWLKRNTNETVTPWNFDRVIDIPTTATNFIREMTNKCTYLLGEDVLPKQSLLYSEYLVRNALNTLNNFGNRLDKDVIEHLYQTLFINRNNTGKITKKRISSGLKNLGIENTTESIGGMDLEIPANMKAHKDFKKIIGDKLSNEEIEEIIEKITVFPDSPSMVKSYIEKLVGEKLDNDEMTRLSRLSYKDWGRFSKKLLTGIRRELPDGRKVSIMDVLRENPFNKDEPLNFMEILHHPELNFQELIDARNEGKIDHPNIIDDEYLESLRLSPSVKKAIIQVLKIAKELISIMGGAPKRVFVEMTRSHEDTGRTASRKQRFNELYKNIQTDVNIWEEELKDLSEDRFKSKKIYLYALQQGKDLYTGKTIDLNELLYSSRYDIDHIYPRSQTKDDSWNNLVLCDQVVNRAKKNDFPINPDIQENMKGLWHALLKQGFLSEEKFKRLTRTNRLSGDELNQFIARQLVETSQSTKAISTIFKRLLVESDVVYVKSGLVSDFRYNDGNREDAETKFYFPKVRDLNDYHHAKDAYLNIVVGNVYHSLFTKRFYERLKEGYKPEYNLVKMYDRLIKETQEEVSWAPGENGTIKTVEKMMRRNNILLTHQTFKQSGGFFDQMLMKKGKGQYPIKSTNPALHQIDKYGAYNKVGISHYCIAKFKEGKKEKISILGVPILLKQYGFTEKVIKAHYEKDGLKDIEILYPEIQIRQIIVRNGLEYRVLGKSGGNLKCSTNFSGSYCLDFENNIKELERYLLNKRHDDKVLQDIKNTYLYLVQKLLSKPFSEYSALLGQGKKLRDRAEFFETLDQEQQVKVVLNIIRLLNGNGMIVDLSDVYTDPGKSRTGSQSGMITMNLNIPTDEMIEIINESITGFYKNKVRIV